MEGRGTVYKRCGCRDPHTGRQRGRTCPLLRRRGHGSWYLALPLPVTLEDHRGRLRRGGYRTRAEAGAALRRLRDPELARRGGLVTVGQWLARWYGEVERRLRPTTVRGYRKHVEQYLRPLLGRELLCELSEERVQRMFHAIVQLHREAGRPLSGGTLRRIQATLRAALSAAVYAGLLARNPARHLDLPRAPRPHPVVWNADLIAHWRRTGQRPALAVWDATLTAAFLGAIHAHRLYALFHLYALRGLRRGEGVGVRWTDIDLTAHTLTVQRQLQKREGGVLEACPPKTRAGVRAVALDHTTVRALQEHRRRQEAERRAAGDAWLETGYVFTDPLGRPLKPDHVTHTFQRMVRDHDLPPIRLHDLRHSAATLALAAGCDLKTIQHQSGHQSIVTTADTYVSVLPSTAHEAAEATARLILDAARQHARTLRHQPTQRRRSPALQPRPHPERRTRSSPR